MQADIEIVKEMRGTWYVLPRRTFPGLKKVGRALLVAGAFFTAFMVFWMWDPVTDGVQTLMNDGSGGLFSLIFGLMGLFGLVPALMILILGAGLASNRTHSRVGLMENGIRVREYSGPFHWTWKRSANQISEIRAVKGLKSNNAEAQKLPVDLTGLSDLVMVTARCTGKKRSIPLVIGYPHELVSELVEQIERHLNGCASRYGAVANPLSVEWVDGEEDLLKEVPRPENSAVILEKDPDGIIFKIPPRGLIKGSKGLFFFALFWNLIIGVVFLSFLNAWIKNGTGGDLGALAFLVIFLAIGVGLLLGAVNMGRKQAVMRVTSQSLAVVTKGLRKPKEKSWALHEIKEICMGNSGVEINDRPVKELQIIPNDGKKSGFLSQLSEAEILWIAYELRKAVHLESSSCR